VTSAESLQLQNRFARSIALLAESLRSQHRFACRKFFLRLFCVGCVLAAASAHATSRLAFDLGGAVGYDDNVFQYSPRDESVFIYHQNPTKFPFRSLDDAVIDVTGKLTLRSGIIPRHTTHFGLAATLHQYVSNPVKSNLTGDVRVRQYFAKSFYVEASYVLYPRYLIRYFHDPRQFTSYKPCTFTEHLATAQVDWRPSRKLELKPFARYEVDRYQTPFEYYDTKAWREGCEARITPLRMLELAIAYEHKAARTGRTVMPDISYDQHDANVSLKPKFGRVTLELGYDYAWRGHTASPAIDTTHARRIDVIRSVVAGASIALSKAVAVTIDFRHNARTSSSPYRADIDDVKDYVENAVGIGVRAGGNR
jgi:hypothetical protein